MSTVPATGDAGVVNGYETLRSCVIAGDASPAKGLALVLRSGLPAWISTWNRTVRSSTGAMRYVATAPVRTGGADIAMVLTAMALAVSRAEA